MKRLVKSMDKTIKKISFQINLSGNKKNKFLIFFFIFLVIFTLSCSKNNTDSNDIKSSSSENSYEVTFIELGSVQCVPCRMMQPIMEEIKRDYKGKVNVLFYDVWTPSGRPYATKYRIRVIPTQIFLDKNGNEYYRHEGYFPKEQLIKIIELKLKK